VYCYLNQKTCEQLEAIKQEEDHDSLSQAMKEIILLGIKVYLNNKDKPELDEDEKRRLEKMEELKEQQTTNILRLLGVSADILRCVYDKSKVNDGSENADDHISLLKVKVDNYVDSYINS
jgi:hypothetical protein